MTRPGPGGGQHVPLSPASCRRPHRPGPGSGPRTGASPRSSACPAPGRQPCPGTPRQSRPQGAAVNGCPEHPSPCPASRRATREAGKNTHTPAVRRGGRVDAALGACRTDLRIMWRPLLAIRVGQLVPRAAAHRSEGLRPDPILWSELWAATCGSCRLCWRKWSQLKNTGRQGQ